MITATISIDPDFTMKSEYFCKYCKKNLLSGIYITLNNQDHKVTSRMCYSCQLDTYGLDFTRFGQKSPYTCYYCNKNLIRIDLLVEQLKYYIFTDMADAKQIVFCSTCFEANSPK